MLREDSTEFVTLTLNPERKLQYDYSDQEFAKFINRQNNKGQTPLLLAIIKNHPEAFRILLHGIPVVDLRIPDKDGHTAWFVLLV